MAGGDENIAWLQVAMDDAQTVSPLHTDQRLFEDPYRGRDREPAFVMKPLRKGLAFDIFHYQHEAAGLLEQ